MVEIIYFHHGSPPWFGPRIELFEFGSRSESRTFTFLRLALGRVLFRNLFREKSGRGAPSEMSRASRWPLISRWAACFFRNRSRPDLAFGFGRSVQFAQLFEQLSELFRAVTLVHDQLFSRIHSLGGFARIYVDHGYSPPEGIAYFFFFFFFSCFE